jgi:tRNA (guanine-N7-)-methyltransferase
MRKKKNLVPRMETCADLWIKAPTEYQGNWRKLKPDAARLRLELGCGKGRFTAGTAAEHPEDLYVAIERVPDAMVIAMERCRALGLTNVFFIDGDAACLADYFAPDEVDLLYINFCDPWPSVKHSRRRLTHEGFLRGYRQVLKDGGQIHFKTDNRDLFEWSLFQFPKAGFALSEVTRDLHANGVQGVMTDYEEKFHQLGTPINRCVGTKGPLPDVTEAQGPDVAVRPMAEADKLAVLRLSRQWAQENAAGTYRAWDLAGLKRCRCWVAQVGKAVAGYALAQPDGDGTLQITEHYVDPDHRGMGVGQKLLDTAEDVLRRENVESGKNL